MAVVGDGRRVRDPGDEGGHEPAAAPGVRSSGRLPRVLTHNRDYRRYWASQVVSLTGTWMQQVASSLVVLTLTSSAVAIGAISVLASLPMLLLTLSGGVLADRHDKRLILLATQSLLAGFAVIYAGLLAFDVLAYWQIAVLAILSGTTAAYELPASQAFTPELVDREDLPQAIALNGAAFNGARLMGPAVAGVAIAATSLTTAFIGNALSFLAVIGVLLSMRGRSVARHAVPAKAGTALREGLTYVRGQPALVGLTGLVGLTSLLVFPHLFVLLPLYVTDVLGARELWVGVIMSCAGGGSLVGSIAILRGDRGDAAALRRVRLAGIGVATGLLVLGLVRTPWLAAPGAAVLSFSVSLGMSQAATTVQQRAPDALRGRVMSIHSLAFTGVMPFAVLLVSGATELLGQPMALLGCAVAYALGAVAFYRRLIRPGLARQPTDFGPRVPGDALAAGPAAKMD